METYNIRKITFPQINTLMLDIPEDIFKKLNEDADIKNFQDATNYGSSLVGHINHQYLFENSTYLTDFILDISKLYYPTLISSGYVQQIHTRNSQLKCGIPWINFQAPTEYNPLHNHSGLMSWVIWLKIPFEREKEQEIFPNSRYGRVVNGSFQFAYSSAKGVELYNIDLDKSYEGKMLMFPSAMHHQVYPFYSTDEYRISLSGNVYVDIDPNNKE